jgi:hypothetical protein
MNSNVLKSFFEFAQKKQNLISNKLMIKTEFEYLCRLGI